MDEDYYKILGVKRDASQKEIQRAYRDLARKFHPDMNPNDKKAKEKFQRVQQAYDVLNDPEKRELYDRYGSSFQSAGAGGGPRWTYQGPGAGGSFEEFDFSQLFGSRGSEGFADIFRQFSGGRAQGRRGGTPRGSDLEHAVEIPFQTAVSGGEVTLQLHRPDGRAESLAVKIPAGMEDGNKIRLRGQGEPGSGRAKPGDLLLTVRVAPHPYFRRRGNDLEVIVPVSLGEAALGAKIDVPTPRGTITLTVPRGSSSGRRLRAKGQGIASGKGPPGDLYAELRIVLPGSIDDETAEQIRAFETRYPLHPRAELRW
ncbi:MAG: DnaJ domain-containing protein [Pirellulaceae bacterium]|jgi:DnaJ-class molecular chaperone|nr:DnaJ domain-containing protein [Pirellulaceae bacterium]